MNENIRPARAVAPGRIILKELEARGWNQKDLAAIMNRPEQAISEIVRAKKQITPETAHQLANAFGTTPDFWVNLEMQYQLNQVKQKNKGYDIERRSQLYNLAPITEMLRRGWIDSVKTADKLEKEYCRFYQLSSISQQPQTAYRLRISKDRSPKERSIIAWVRRIEQLAEAQDVQSFSVLDLPEIVKKLQSLTDDETNIEKIPKLLLNHGIHFVIVPHLPKTYLDGVTFWMDDHPVIGLSLRYDRIDAFWFTLFHELAHIYLNHRQTQIDQLFDRENQDVSGEEQAANHQAAQWLLPKEVLTPFIVLNRPRYSRSKVETFAKSINRHPGIVVGQLMHQGEIKYSQLRTYLVKVEPYLQKWIDIPFPN